MVNVVNENGTNIDSLAAYESVKPFLSESRHRVLNALNELGPSTYKEIGHHLKIDFANKNWSTITARLGELKRLGYAEPTEDKRDGCRVIVITEKGKQIL